MQFSCGFKNTFTVYLKFNVTSWNFFLKEVFHFQANHILNLGISVKYMIPVLYQYLSHMTNKIDLYVSEYRVSQHQQLLLSNIENQIFFIYK